MKFTKKILRLYLMKKDFINNPYQVILRNLINSEK